MSSTAIVLQAQPRTEIGKSLNTLRAGGQVPANVYERGKQSQAISASAADLAKVYHAAGKHHAVELQIGKDRHLAMIKDVDFDPVKGRIRHIAFHAVNKNETVEAEVPVRLADDIPAIRASLMVITPVDMVIVEAKPGDLPDEFIAPVESLLDIGDKITVADLTVPAGVTILTDTDTTLAVVEMPKDQIAAAAAEAVDAETAGDVANAVPSEHGTDEKDITK